MPDGWRWMVRDGLPLLVAEALDRLGVPHALTGRQGGVSAPPFETLNLGRGVGDGPGAVASNRARVLAALGRSPDNHIEAAQVHGRRVAVVAAADRGRTVPEADGLATADPEVVLAIHCADCVPILLADGRGRAVAAVHAGWRGTAAGVAHAAVAAMAEAFGCAPADLTAVLGPAIGPCCYEVDEPVYARFAPWGWRGQVFAPSEPGRWRLDLWAANRRALLDAGLMPDAITVIGVCTAHHPALFFSHRRDGTTGRMAAMVAVRRE